MRLLVCSVTNTEPEILQPHLESVKNQELPENVKVDYYYITDPDISESSKVLLDSMGFTTAKATPKPEGAEYSVSDNTHHWSKPTFYWLGAQKQRLLEKGLNYEAVFIVDSDLVLDSGTISSLLATDKDVVSAVFWTKWVDGSPSLPQVWMENPYEFQGRGVEAHEHLRNAATRQLWQVGGLGACTLIRKDALNKVRYYPPLPNLPEDGMWQGEDRTFAIVAQRNHVELWADAWPNIYHVYRPSYISKISQIVENIENVRKQVPEFGDYVSVRLTPVEEANLTGWTHHYRGRIGSGDLLYALEQQILRMNVGDNKFIKVRFPAWWLVPEYRNQIKTVRVELLDAKKPLPHPATEEDEDFGIYYRT